ncbi:monocarboxylate transporter 12-like [Saccoglossus kowalevskii]|uniref:Monocarboxylate transporter 12-like n=1 Tax=Saccoglossus kowalevskii TaxID=10224 RepID=A0ABM0H1N4_SACKO|nr:PREDICTED: monocarboxylate transporter 12-like [Saccoglossus kowalevskii]
MQTPTLYNPPDGGWGWAVTFGAFIVLFLAAGLPQCIGVFFFEFRRYYHADAKQVSILGALFFSMVFLLSPISSAMANKIGTRPVVFLGGVISMFGLVISAFASGIGFLCISLGIITGFGCSLGMVPSMAIIGHYFNQKHSVASSMALTGPAFATIILPRLCSILIGKFGWRGSIIIVGALMMNMCVGASFYRPAPMSTDKPRRHRYDDEDTEDEVSDIESSLESLESTYTANEKPKNIKRKICDLALCKDFYRYVMICIVFVFIGFAAAIAMSFLMPRALAAGASRTKAGILMAIVGIVNFISRIILGFLTKCVSPYKIFCIDIFIFAIISIGSTFGKAYIVLLLYAVVFGIFMATLGVLPPIIFRRMVGPDRFQSAMGLSMMCCGIGLLLGPIIGGSIVGNSGSFSAAILLSGFVFLISFSILLTEPCFEKCEFARDVENATKEGFTEDEIIEQLIVSTPKHHMTKY